MKKHFTIIILLIILFPISIYAEPKYLYDVLKKEAESGGLAKLYEGEHHDSFIEEPSKNIYHWYAETDDEGNQVLEKNNVVFGGFCWQMIRTTDTGGVKLLYNGEPTITTVDGKEKYYCGSNRPDHFETSEGQVGIDGNYYYSNEYSSSLSNGKTVFQLINPVQVNVTQYNKPSTVYDIIEKYPYTCKSTSATGTCTKLVKVTRLEEKPHVYPSAYGYITIAPTIIGSDDFNYSSDRLSAVGYMWNKTYTDKYKTVSNNFNGLERQRLNYSTKYYFGTGITYNSTTNEYTLTGIKQSEISYVSSESGLYTCNSSSSYTCSTVYYFKEKSFDTYYGLAIKDGHYLNYYSLKLGKSYYTNLSGKYVLNNVSTVLIPDFFYNFNSRKYEGYYTCNNNESTCDNVKKIIFGYDSYYSYLDTEKKITFSHGYSYNAAENKYILSDDKIDIWDTTDSNSLESLKTHHYTCFSKETECEKLYYVFYVPSLTVYYIELSSGIGAENAISQMLYDDNVNSNSSNIKKKVDYWYENQMTEFNKYIEDTIFCNDRTINNYESSGWNPNGGNVKTIPLYGSGNGLKCKNQTDSFSINNERAKLTYPVGLLTSNELDLFENNNARKSITSYWLLSPYNHYEYSDLGANLKIVSISGELSNKYSSSLLGIRPAISIIPNIRYLSGTGSTANPYVIDYNTYYNISINSNENGNVSLDLEDNESVANKDIEFVVNPNEGYKIKSISVLNSRNESITYTLNNNKYKFTMPESDVSINVEYEKIKYSVDVDIKNETKDYEIEIEDLTNITMGDEVAFTITPVEGYKVNEVIIKDENGNEIAYTLTDNNEYKFIMPAGNITITPVYERVSNEVNINDNDLGEIKLEINDSSAVVYEDKVVFTVTPEKGYKVDNIIIIDENNNNINYEEDNNKYSFIMPSTDVTISPTYAKVKNKIRVVEDKNTKEIILEVEDSSSVEYEEKVKFKVIPKDGYEVENIIITDEDNNNIEYKKTTNDNEYEFIMSYVGVSIKPMYKKVDTSNIVIPDTWSSNFLIALIVLSIGFIFIRRKHLVK